MLCTALVSTLLLALLAHGSVDDAYYATYTRLSGLLLGSAFAFSFAPYRIRGNPGKTSEIARLTDPDAVLTRTNAGTYAKEFYTRVKTCYVAA